MSDAKPVSLLAVCGSLRKGSFNRAAMNTAIELKPAGMTVTVADIAQIPLYDEDVRAQGFPPPVETLRQQIKAADALLFACPEYNYSMSGVLKNAIDWASRPPEQPFAGKPVAMISAAAGMAGGARAQLHLRQSCVFLDMHPLNKPEVLIFQAQNKFDDSGKLTDETARNLIRDLMANLLGWARQIGARA
ncbi:MAG: NAD(P)H-dependent oxidoreductase [Alphaproteobacteria bacterium]|nr:NAD(P)H-dependent oxidoreductase [Alphaproteobacteria bacterium]MBV9553742.1 NAD(P)H-dependent oxidoreductase [Alphaproteobacteria bacterium]